MPPTAYVLNQSLVAHYPTRWDIHARYAMRLPGETLELPAGTWLLALPTDTGDVPHYRLADGRVVCPDAPLTPEQAAPLTSPQALNALALYRPLEQDIFEDWGVQVEQVDLLPRFASFNARFVLGQPGKSHQPLRRWVSPPSGATGVRLSSTCAIRQVMLDSSWIVSGSSTSPRPRTISCPAPLIYN